MRGLLVKNAQFRAKILNLGCFGQKYPIKGKNSEFGGVTVKNVRSWSKILRLGCYGQNCQIEGENPEFCVLVKMSILDQNS